MALTRPGTLSVAQTPGQFPRERSYSDSTAEPGIIISRCSTTRLDHHIVLYDMISVTSSSGSCLMIKNLGGWLETGLVGSNADTTSVEPSVLAAIFLRRTFFLVLYSAECPVHGAARVRRGRLVSFLAGLYGAGRVWPPRSGHYRGGV